MITGEITTTKLKKIKCDRYLRTDIGKLYRSFLVLNCNHNQLWKILFAKLIRYRFIILSILRLFVEMDLAVTRKIVQHVK